MNEKKGSWVRVSSVSILICLMAGLLFGLHAFCPCPVQLPNFGWQMFSRPPVKLPDVAHLGVRGCGHHARSDADHSKYAFSVPDRFVDRGQYTVEDKQVGGSGHYPGPRL
jgi:hypothetical protein